MKKLFVIIGLALVAGVTHAQNIYGGYAAFSAPGTAINGGTNYVVVPGYSGAGGTSPQVNYIALRANAATAITLQSYYVTNMTYATTTNSGTTLTVNSTNGFAAGNWVVINHTTLPTVIESEAALISAVQNTNQIVLAASPRQNVAAGDVVYQQTAGALISVPASASAATYGVGSGGIINGQPGLPLLLVLSSTGVGTNTIDACSASFIK